MNSQDFKQKVEDNFGLSKGTVNDYKTHFECLIITTNGISCVDPGRDKMIVHCLQSIFRALLGEEAMSSIIISGSAAQGLKCERANRKGDADIVLISGFPTITKEDQINAFEPGSEPGIFKIKASPEWS